MSATPGAIATHGAVTIRSRPAGDHVPPARLRRLDAQSEERQPALEQDRVADAERRGHDRRADRVRQHVAQEHAQRARCRAHGPRRPTASPRAPITSARTSRATPIQPVAASTTTTVAVPGRHSAAHSSSRISRGIASIASETAIAARSSAPRHHPAAAPIATPVNPATAEPTTPIASDNRPASIIRTNRSRPKRSVPSR